MLSPNVTAELARYRELLQPLAKLDTNGPAELPGDERQAWQHALSAVRDYPVQPLDLEEAVATFARALWGAPAWAEPPARIAEALVRRVTDWPEPEHSQGLEIALRFAERALSLDQGNVTARIAMARVRLATGETSLAEKAASALPTHLLDTLALRSEIAEARGDLTQAIELRAAQIETTDDPASIREGRDRLASLHQAQGDEIGAIEVLRANLSEFPDHAAGRLRLGLALRGRGELLDAFAELDSAVLLGHAEAHAALEEVAVELDRRALANFRHLLRAGRDGDSVELCPAPATPPAR